MSEFVQIQAAEPRLIAVECTHKYDMIPLAPRLLNLAIPSGMPQERHGSSTSASTNRTLTDGQKFTHKSHSFWLSCVYALDNTGTRRRESLSGLKRATSKLRNGPTDGAVLNLIVMI
jgi:hypothetical protein